jgi:hypothetical protein
MRRCAADNAQEKLVAWESLFEIQPYPFPIPFAPCAFAGRLYGLAQHNSSIPRPDASAYLRLHRCVLSYNDRTS